jgi:hypothetical protein
LRRRLGRFLGRLRLRRLLLIVGRLPFLLIRGAPCGASTSEDFLAGHGKRPGQFLCAPPGPSRSRDRTR